MSRTPSPHGPTLREILQRPNPELADQWAGSLYESTRSAINRGFDKVAVVKPWTDFTYDAIQLAYGDILDTGIKAFQRGYATPDAVSETPTTILTEDSVDHLGFA